MTSHLITQRIRPLGLAAVALVLGVTAAGVVTVPALPAAAASTLVVNASQPFRPVTHVASGSLYGLATASVPADNLVEPLHPNTFVQMAAGGHQQAEGDVMVVAPEAAKAGARIVDRMSDYYAGWPYQFSWSSWPGVVQQQVQQVEASPYAGITNFELWNEPDNTWLAANGTFNAFWVRTYNQVRSLDPGARIQGPSFSDNISGMQSFLANAVATNTVPDVLSWHELESSGKIAGDVTTVTNIEKSLGITPRPIAIEEYAAPAQVGIPGDLIGYIAQFERLGISNAELAFWNHYGALGDLLTGTGGSPNAAYWLYDWYGQMTGNMITVTPPGTPGTGLDGAASLNSAGNQVSVIFGGGSGATAVTVNGLSAFGATAHVVLDHVVSQGRTTPVAAAQIQSTTASYPISNGSITVPVSNMNAADGYHLVVTPASSTGNTGTGPIVAGDNAAKCVDNNGGAATNGNKVQMWDCTGAAAEQSWTVASNGTLQIDGGCMDITGANYSNGTLIEWWPCNGGANQQWQAVNGELVNPAAGKCLDDPGSNTANGTQLILWSCNGGANQQWHLP
jgi:hypothetical protein